jgi:SNF2 family DNA or RNA helicase
MLNFSPLTCLKYIGSKDTREEMRKNIIANHKAKGLGFDVLLTTPGI